MESREAFRVVKPGPQTTVQDLGRPGYLHTGMPQSGAQDAWALRVANLLVGNDVGGAFGVQAERPGAAGLEILMPGLTLAAQAEVAVAVTGADMAPEVNGDPVPMWTTIQLSAGDELRLSSLRSGLRSYLAVSGGIAVDPVLGSRSTYLRGALGGFRGRALRAGDALPAYNVDESPGDLQVPEDRREVTTPGRLRVVFGPQGHLYSDAGRRTFLESDWTLLPDADRMGFRMEGPALEFLPAEMLQSEYEPPFIVDDFIPLGGIQTPSDGLIIAMGVDGPSLGGFAKIATVISTDFGRLAQTRPGQTLHFDDVSWEDALALARELNEALMSGSLLESR